MATEAITAQSRKETGKGAARTLRRQALIRLSSEQGTLQGKQTHPNPQAMRHHDGLQPLPILSRKRKSTVAEQTIPHQELAFVRSLQVSYTRWL